MTSILDTRPGPLRIPPDSGLLEVARRSPRGRFGLARVSVWWTSFGMSKDVNSHDIFFPRYGRIRNDLDVRIPRQNLYKLVEEVNAENPKQGHKRVGYRVVRSLVRDAEAAVLHWAADQAFPGTQNVSTQSADLLGKLSSLIAESRSLPRIEQSAFYQCLSLTVPSLKASLMATDDLDIALLEAVVRGNRTGAGRNRGDDPATVTLMNAFMDDWRRHTGRPLTYGTKAGSARHFYGTVIEEMVRSPPAGPENSIPFHTARLLPALRLNLDKPLERALRSIASQTADTK